MVIGYLIVGILTGVFGGVVSFALDHGIWLIAPIAYLSALMGFTSAAAARYMALEIRQH